jgi:hypothetical protein
VWLLTLFFIVTAVKTSNLTYTSLRLFLTISYFKVRSCQSQYQDPDWRIAICRLSATVYLIYCDMFRPNGAAAMQREVQHISMVTLYSARVLDGHDNQECETSTIERATLSIEVAGK